VKPNICICEDGKISPTCSGDARDTGDCRATCLNGGTCSEGKCICRTGYSGEFCQVKFLRILAQLTVKQ